MELEDLVVTEKNLFVIQLQETRYSMFIYTVQAIIQYII